MASQSKFQEDPIIYHKMQKNDCYHSLQGSLSYEISATLQRYVFVQFVFNILGVWVVAILDIFPKGSHKI